MFFFAGRLHVWLVNRLSSQQLYFLPERRRKFARSPTTCVVQACPKMTTTLRSVRHAACVVLVLGLVTSCSSETPADDADRLSQDGDSVTARSGVGPAIDAELVLKDLMLWMRDNHDLAPLLHPENSDWLERFAPRGPSGEQTVALSFALRSALSREMEKAALLREGFDA